MSCTFTWMCWLKLDEETLNTEEEKKVCIWNTYDFHIAIADSAASSDIVKSGLRWVSPFKSPSLFSLVFCNHCRTKEQNKDLLHVNESLLSSSVPVKISAAVISCFILKVSPIPCVIYVFTSLVNPSMCFTCVSLIPPPPPQLPRVTLWWSLYFCVASLFSPGSLLDIFSLTDSVPLLVFCPLPAIGTELTTTKLVLLSWPSPHHFRLDVTAVLPLILHFQCKPLILQEWLHVFRPDRGASQSSACTLLTGDTGRWRCGPPPLGCWLGGRKTRRQRRVRARNSARRGRQRYMAIQTLVFYPSLIGKLSTVNSALKLDIDPSIPPSSPCPAQPHPHLSLSSFGTAHFPFWWFFPLFLSPSDSFTLILCHSGGSPRLGFFFFVINVSLPSFHLTCFFFHPFPDPTWQWK